MRHRLRVSLYDEYAVDAAIVDYLESLPATHRSDMLQRLVRVGFQVLLQNVDVPAAYQEASLPTLKERADSEAGRAMAMPLPTLQPPAAKPQEPALPATTPASIPAAAREPAPVKPAPAPEPSPIEGASRSEPVTPSEPVVPKEPPSPTRPAAPRPAPNPPHEELLDVDPRALADEAALHERHEPAFVDEPPSDAFSRMKRRAQRQPNQDS